VLFIKAFANVAVTCPPLRQNWFGWPWDHLYEHPHSVAMIATHRDFRDEPWLFWSRFINPEGESLPSLQRRLDRYLTEPPETIFKQQWLFSGLPKVVRRVLWWWNLNVSGPKRAKRAGTFFLTTLAGQGAEIAHPPAFLTSNITYGPLDERGCCRVTIAYDHRLMDGSLVAKCLADLEQTLKGPISRELEQLCRSGGDTKIQSAA